MIVVSNSSPIMNLAVVGQVHLDERRGRTVASHLGLKFIGLLGALVEGKRKGYVAAVKPILDDLMAQAGFWVSAHLYSRVLREVGE